MQQTIALVVGATVLALLVAALRDAFFITQRDEFERAEDVRRRREAALLRVGVLLVALALVAALPGSASVGPSVGVSVDADLRKELRDIAASNRELAQSVADLRAGLEVVVGASGRQVVTAIQNHSHATAESFADGAGRRRPEGGRGRGGFRAG